MKKEILIFLIIPFLSSCSSSNESIERKTRLEKARIENVLEIFNENKENEIFNDVSYKLENDDKNYHFLDREYKVLNYLSSLSYKEETKEHPILNMTLTYRYGNYEIRLHGSFEYILSKYSYSYYDYEKVYKIDEKAAQGLMSIAQKSYSDYVTYVQEYSNFKTIKDYCSNKNNEKTLFAVINDRFSSGVSHKYDDNFVVFNKIKNTTHVQVKTPDEIVDNYILLYDTNWKGNMFAPFEHYKNLSNLGYGWEYYMLNYEMIKLVFYYRNLDFEIVTETSYYEINLEAGKLIYEAANWTGSAYVANSYRD